jgi:hypothetical protein
MGSRGLSVKALAQILHVSNVVLFIGIIWMGMQRFLEGQNPLSQLIALGVAIVGPLEDYLKKLVRRGKPSHEETAVEVVDKATSAFFLALLLWVLILLS